MMEWVRPHAVYRAAEYMVEQTLYEKEGIEVNINFLAQHQQEEEVFVVDGKDIGPNKYEEVVYEWDETPIKKMSKSF